MRLLPKSIHRCRRYPTKFNSGRDIPAEHESGELCRRQHAKRSPSKGFRLGGTEVASNGRSHSKEELVFAVLGVPDAERCGRTKCLASLFRRVKERETPGPV